MRTQRELLMRKPQKKALLIGINYEESQEDIALNGPHQDVRQLEKSLINHWGYEAANITVMLDLRRGDPGYDPMLHPTDVNILREIDRLVKGAQPGNNFVFHFSGHSGQIPNEDGTEEDGFDQVIYTIEGNYILDDVLKAHLVDPLPVGSKLIAILDTCHSGTLLDLPHYRCNRVWVPWISKGVRRAKTMWSQIVRCNALLLPMKGSIDRALDRRFSKNSPGSPRNAPIDILRRSPGQHMRTRSKNSSRGRSATVKSERSVPSVLCTYFLPELQRTTSPEQLPIFPCHGFCRDVREPMPVPQANVISISAAKDSQRACESPDGVSMTAMLIRIMEQDPKPSLRDMMTKISHDIHDFYLHIHKSGHDWIRHNSVSSDGSTTVVELVNFQDPQISSFMSLNMEEPLSF